MPHSIPLHTPPYHNVFSTKLDCSLHLPLNQTLSLLFPDPLPPIWPKPVDFSFIWPNDSLPVLYSPVSILQSKCLPLLPIPCTQQGLFLLHYSLEWIFPEDSSDCFWGDWCRNDGVDVVGGFYSIGSLASSDLSQNCSLRGSRKLGRTTPRGVMLIKMEISECSGYCGLAETKSGGNSASRMAIGGQRKNVFLLSRGGGMHWGIIRFWQC